MAWVDRMNFGQASFWGTVDADPTAAAGLAAPAENRHGRSNLGCLVPLLEFDRSNHPADRER